MDGSKSILTLIELSIANTALCRATRANISLLVGRPRENSVTNRPKKTPKGKSPNSKPAALLFLPFYLWTKIPMETTAKPTVSELLLKPKEDILAFLGCIYENSPFVAARLFDIHGDDSSNWKITNVHELFLSMSNIVDISSQEEKLQLIRSHPDLCEKIDKLRTLTLSSQHEQTSAGLHTLTDEERTRFADWNEKYKAKFGFPFILAVRNVTKYTVLSAIEGRLNLSWDTEFAGALYQVHKIAWMRLLAAFHITHPKGFLTCHVLDTAQGCPASNMRIQLHRLTPPEKAGLVGEFITNTNGRLDNPALQGEEFVVGSYEYTFFVGDYFARSNFKTCGTPFLDVVPLRFGIDNPEEHYHVPLLVSPWSYSTYRGS
jgi:2-oxo-4-hydroxy-4-carboxy-5-ureidoimidazoline decarboxylase